MSAARRRLWVTVGAVLGLAVTSALGVWQLGRASEKSALWAQREAREHLAPLGWDDLRVAAGSGEWAALHDRRVRLRGQWQHAATVFLDNRPMNGRTGFIVVTPLRADNGATLAVQRGWVPRRLDDRTALPHLPEPAGWVELTGRLAPPPSKLYEFDAQGQGRIRQNIYLDAYGAEWSLRLYPVSLQQSAPPGVADGMDRDWPKVGADVHKHYGYAFQWFGLGALITVLYVWFHFIVPRRQRA